MENKSKKVCIIGMGYIGLPTAALLANKGYQVLGVDIIPEVVETINRGQIHIVEPELDAFVRSAVNSGNLKASLKPDFSDIFVIAVPTPFHHTEDVMAIPKPNIDYVVDGAKSIIPFLKSDSMIILESTSPVGTTELIKKIFDDHGVNTSQMKIAYCPERVLPGHIIRELVENDRIVGGVNEDSTLKVAEFYRTFVKGEVLETNARTAEMAKLTENSFRDVNIAFANELSMICDRIGVNVWNLIKLANRHPRVNVLMPGCGVGGHCIAVDPWFIVDAAPVDSKLITTARRQNDYKSEWAFEKVKNKILTFEKEHKRAPYVVCMGLAFKPDIDDLRESPALKIAEKLTNEKFNVFAVEPNIQKSKTVNLVGLNEAVEKADIFVFLVAHKEFKKLNINPEKVIDFCGVMNSAGTK